MDIVITVIVYGFAMFGLTVALILLILKNCIKKDEKEDEHIDKVKDAETQRQEPQPD